PRLFCSFGAASIWLIVDCAGCSGRAGDVGGLWPSGEFSGSEGEHRKPKRRRRRDSSERSEDNDLLTRERKGEGEGHEECIARVGSERVGRPDTGRTGGGRGTTACAGRTACPGRRQHSRRAGRLCDVRACGPAWWGNSHQLW